MGRQFRKRGRIGEPAAMEETGRAGARTRSARTVAVDATGGRRCAKRRKTLVRAENQISYPDLRSRSAPLRPQIARSTANSGVPRRSISVLRRITRCSINASSAASPASRLLELGEEFDMSRRLILFNGQREEMAASSNHGDEARDVESTADGVSRRRSMAEASPSEAELEVFFASFAAAEADSRQRFAERLQLLKSYNELGAAGALSSSQSTSLPKILLQQAAVIRSLRRNLQVCPRVMVPTAMRSHSSIC
ncbi:cyclin-dependent kinase inhibitor 3 [Canna indica]|uniref:Cyclin-dependent kinase inhibitor 3 n=1 Tax=Canna indica TaxID=4628 RepID=A0AAQ3KBX8_9LILI|nr:cyclin-dependent kinase inhibitor 3 [Canna indica]